MRNKLSRAVDYLGFIRRTLGELNGYNALAFELIQNADDTAQATWLRFDIREEALWVEDDGGFTDCGDQTLLPDDCPFLDERGHRCDFHSFRLVSSADKRLREDTTGAFGIGFTAVYQVTDRPEIISGERHWTLDETAAEDERIVEDGIAPPQEGTRIVLPWARNPNSEFRRRVGAAPVSDTIEDELVEVLEEAISPAMLFLRHLSRIELALSGTVVSVMTREVDGEDVIIEDSGSVKRWRVLHGSFKDEATNLRGKHADRIESARKPEVAVAIPIGFDIDGRLCSTLPTAQPTGLPIHASAELYLTSDRRQLEMGTPHHHDWNAAALDCAAQMLAGALGDLPPLLGAERLWAALDSARATAGEDQTEAVTEALAAFWEHLETEIPKHELVWTNGEDWVNVEEARLIQATEDENSSPILEELGIPTVHRGLRPRQNILRAVGVRVLSVTDIAAALHHIGLDEDIRMSNLPAPLGEEATREQLWSQLGRMIGRLGDRDKRKARAELDAAVMPSTDGRLCDVGSLWRTDAASAHLMSQVAPGFPLLDHERLPAEARPLLELCDELTASDAADELVGMNADLRLNGDSVRVLLGWFAHREQELGDRDLQTVASLPIFPSAEALHPLSDLALSGDFEDPLQLALLVEREVSREHAGFLGRLGARPLSFENYACEQIPRAFEEGGLTVEQRRRVVSLLARQRGQLEDIHSARSILRTVPLVECGDGEWRVAGEVYLDSEAIRQVLGSQPPKAKLPDEHRGAVGKLLAWLGVSEEPRAEDVIGRVEEIIRREADGPRRKDVERIVVWLGRKWKDLQEGERAAFETLRQLSWLPMRGGEGWHAPNNLDLVFQAHLYESQGRFLGIGVRIQQETVEFLRWLGVRDTPTVEQVVAHLRYCAETDTPPNRNVYEFLNNNVGAPAIRRLQDTRCLRIEGRWCRPDEVYWSEPPFGRWRSWLGREFARYPRLLEELGVKEDPDHRDAMRVISDISEEYAPYSRRIPAEDLKVLRNCWELCEQAFLSGALGEGELVSFGKQRVIADQRDILTQAPHLFFEDLPGLADRLPGIHSHIIQRPDGAWRAMEAAGVRVLSKVAVAQIVEVGDRVDGEEIRTRLVGRQEELARSIVPRTTIPWRHLAEQVGSLQVVAFDSMAVAWELQAFGHRFSGEPWADDALWQDREDTLYIAVGEDGPMWEAVSRELVRALLPDVEPATLALDIAAALRPGDRAAARRMLDAAGFPSLAPDIQAEISTVATSDLDVVDTVEVDLPEPAGGEDADEDHEHDEQNGGEISSGVREGADGANVSDDHGEDRTPGGAGTSTGRENTTSRSRSRLRSYVVHDGSQDEPGASDREGKITEIDEAGIKAVERFEIASDRSPEIMPHSNPGYDVRSRNQEGEITRYIEVKSSGAQWDGLGAGLSAMQFEHALSKQQQYWLYVVEFALDEERRLLWRIADPAGKITDFMFDDGWKSAAEPNELGKGTVSQ